MVNSRSKILGILIIMIKQSSILLLLSFYVAIHAADPRLEAAFETEYQKSMGQPNSEASTEQKTNKETKENYKK